MGDTRSWGAEQDAIAYERQYGARDRKAAQQLKELRASHAIYWKIETVRFIMFPFGAFGDREHGDWTEELVARVDQLHQQLMKFTTTPRSSVTRD